MWGGHYFLSCNIMFKRIFNGVQVREALLLYARLHSFQKEDLNFQTYIQQLLYSRI